MSIINITNFRLVGVVENRLPDSIANLPNPQSVAFSTAPVSSFADILPVSETLREVNKKKTLYEKDCEKVKHISPCYKWNVILSFFGRSADAGKKIRPC